MGREKGRLWFHVASVGEFNTLRPLLKRLHPDYHITLTYFSFRARDYLKAQAEKGFFHNLRRLPPDIPPVVRAFEKRFRPDAILIMERELWPSLLMFTRAPKIWLNAYAKGSLLERWFSKRFSVILARDCKSYEIFQSYGNKTVVHCGNLKFVLEEPPKIPLDNQGSKLIVAGSTHPGEELLLKEVFSRLKALYPSLKLIIAPRHIARAGEVLGLFGEYRVALRSEKKEDWDVLVLDTLGELFSLYAHAHVAIVGGTFVPVGGHNLLEPAYFGKPVIFGVHTHKVEDIRHFLEQRGMGFCVKDVEELYQLARSLLSENSKLEAYDLKFYSEHVLDCYLQTLRNSLPQNSTIK